MRKTLTELIKQCESLEIDLQSFLYTDNSRLSDSNVESLYNDIRKLQGDLTFVRSALQQEKGTRLYVAYNYNVLISEDDV